MDATDTASRDEKTVESYAHMRAEVESFVRKHLPDGHDAEMLMAWIMAWDFNKINPKNREERIAHALVAALRASEGRLAAQRSGAFAPGDQVRLRGRSSIYGTVVARPYGSALKTGTPVVFDGKQGVSFALTSELERVASSVAGRA